MLFGNDDVNGDNNDDGDDGEDDNDAYDDVFIVVDDSMHCFVAFCDDDDVEDSNHDNDASNHTIVTINWICFQTRLQSSGHRLGHVDTIYGLA